VLSVKKAMQTYARQGGTSSIFICEDGMQLISEEDKKERMAFYANHNIGYVRVPSSRVWKLTAMGQMGRASGT
jgi:hypothetical protein